MHKDNLSMVAIVALAVVISVPMFMVNSASDAQSALSSRASHAPVIIQSDIELATSDAVTDGTGSISDPYVIESWNIDADGSPYGILIANTNHYLEVRFNQVFGGGGGGIILRNVTNVVVLSNAVIDSDGNGIVVRTSRSVSLQFNHIRGHASYGIAVQDSFLMDISDNWIGYGGAGIFMNGTAEARVIHNSILHNDGLGVELASKSAATVVAKNAFVHNNNDGIQATDNGFGNMWFDEDTGNYWSDYIDRYPQAKNDGRIWDTMYRIVLAGGSGVPEGDDFPLVKPMDDLPPAVSELDLGEGYTGESFRYTVRIGDDTYVDRAEARIWTETKELTPAVLWREDPDDWVLELNLPNDSTEPIHVVVTAFDLSGNSASSNEGMITMIDDELPTLVSSTIPEVATTGDPFDVVVRASDNVGIENVWITYAVGSDAPVVDEMAKGSTGEYRRNYTFFQAFPMRISVSLYDGTHNVTVVDAQFNIVDNDAPSMDSGSEKDIIVGDYVIFHAPSATDNIGIVNLTWSFKYRGGHVEQYGDHFNFTFTEVGVHPITLRASDAAGLYDLAFFKVHVLPASPLPDLDGDGIPDIMDDDDDGDGWKDADELLWGSDPMNASSVPLDTDGDRFPDIVDPDDDNDGVLDIYDAFPLDRTEWSDNDGDGIGDNADPDDDNDGMPDIWEMVHGLDPLVAATDDDDLDRDGLGDLREYELVTDPGNPDTDGDGMPDGWEVEHGLDPKRDNRDMDSDGDGFTDLQEFLSGTDPKSVTSIPKEGRDDDCDGISVPVLIAVAAAASVLAGLGVFLSKKGYDHYQAKNALRETGSGMATGKRTHYPLYNDSGMQGNNPLYEGREKHKGWDGTIKGSTKAQDHNSSRSNKTGDKAPVQDHNSSRSNKTASAIAQPDGGLDSSKVVPGVGVVVKSNNPKGGGSPDDRRDMDGDEVPKDPDLRKADGDKVNVNLINTIAMDKGLSRGGNPVPGIGIPIKHGPNKPSGKREAGGKLDPDDDKISSGQDERKSGSIVYLDREGNEVLREAGSGRATGKRSLTVTDEDGDIASSRTGGKKWDLKENKGGIEDPSNIEIRRRPEVLKSNKAQDHNSSRSNKTSSTFDDGGSGSDGATTRSGINTSRSNIKNKGISEPGSEEVSDTRAINHNSTRSNRGNHRSAEAQDHNSSRSNKTSSHIDEVENGGEHSVSNVQKTKHDTVKNSINNVR